MKPRLLDLFCGAGGAAMGYSRAGFDVVGVDINSQPNYPFEFVQEDALWFLQQLLYDDAHGNPNPFDAIHASPPCQAFTAYRRKGHGVGDASPNLVEPTRALLRQTGLPYVIENVEGSPVRGDLMLCGTMFSEPYPFSATPTVAVQRHRKFEANWNVEPPMWPCRHKLNAPRFPASTNRPKGSRRTIAIGQWNTPLARQQEAMGFDWMTLEELSEAIPPAYTEFIGEQLVDHIYQTSTVGGKA